MQLAANALWSWLLLCLAPRCLGLAEVLVLLALIAATAVLFWRIRRLPGVLLLPYLAWVTFASALTWAMWQGNPGAL